MHAKIPWITRGLSIDFNQILAERSPAGYLLSAGYTMNEELFLKTLNRHFFFNTNADSIGN